MVFYPYFTSIKEIEDVLKEAYKEDENQNNPNYSPSINELITN